MSQPERAAPPQPTAGAAEGLWREKYLVARRRGRAFLAIAAVAVVGAGAPGE